MKIMGKSKHFFVEDDVSARNYVKKSEGVETKYQSNSPGVYWIKISDANKLRDKALKAERERIKKILKATKVCECIDIHKCVICKAIDKEETK